jgi:hypothetical protein
MMTYTRETATDEIANLFVKYGDSLPTAKFVLVETPQGWRSDLYFVTGEIIHGYDLFATKEELVKEMLDRLLESDFSPEQLGPRLS